MKNTLEGFERFWDVYPRKVAKLAAARMYEKAIKLASAETILQRATQYAAERKGADPKFTKHPATWLNGGCWEDEAEPQGTYRDAHSVLGAFDRLEAELRARACADDNQAGEDDFLSLPSR